MRRILEMLLIGLVVVVVVRFMGLVGLVAVGLMGWYWGWWQWKGMETFVGGEGGGNRIMTIPTGNLMRSFLDYQHIANPNTQFNLSMLEEQVSPDELQEYLRTGAWKWNDQTKQEYMYAVARNPMINIYPQEALRSAQKVYNETVMRYLIHWNKKAHPERWKVQAGKNMDDYIFANVGNTPSSLGVSV